MSITSKVIDNFQNKNGPLLPPGQFCEVRYENLVRDPVGQLKKIYGILESVNFEKVLPGLQQYLPETADYKANTFEMPPELYTKIKSRWGGSHQALWI